MKYIFAILSWFVLQHVQAQLHDNMWIFKNADTIFHIDFREKPPYISQKDDFIKLHVAKSVFCDANGDLLYYTNCIQINSKIDSLLENGDSLNVGYYANNNSIPVANAGFFLPAPGDSTQCYFIYMYPEKFPGLPPVSVKVQYALIDMTANNGLGKVLEKNVPLLTGGKNLYYQHAGAVRHANGKDWWILVPSRVEPKYYRMLLSPDGFSVPDSQAIGINLPSNDPNFYINYNLFTLDGSKYIDFQSKTGIFQFYDFDRCTGLLSNLVPIPTPHDLSLVSLEGFAFSPSGKKLYALYASAIGDKYQLKQYDLESEDIQNSEQLIWSCDNPGTYQCSAGRMSLAPNGKIYIQAFIDTVAYHVIHFPDNEGAACGFEYGGLVFPAKYPQSAMPYFPNYRLGEVLPILPSFSYSVNGDTVFFQNTSSGGVKYEWDFGDGTIGTGTNVSHIYGQSGTYIVTLTVSEACFSESASDTIEIILTGTTGLDGQVDITVQPNPASGFFNIFLREPFSNPTEVSLYDATGRLVLQQRLIAGWNVLSSVDLLPGLYFYEIKEGNKRLKSGKLVRGE